jgi:hypothetical protein
MQRQYQAVLNVLAPFLKLEPTLMLWTRRISMLLICKLSRKKP